MPAPAVYVLAIVGTVGAAILFKEFVYEPHIAPRIDRWKVEFEAARTRRAELKRSAEVALLQSGAGKDGYQHSADDNNDDSYHSDDGLAKGTSTLRPPVQPHMKNGLLIRRRGDLSEVTSGRKPGDIELDDWITGTSTATETAQQSDLRSRKNNGPLNELIQPIPRTPFLPTSPSRMPTSIRTGGENSKTGRKPLELEVKKTISKDTEHRVFLDESVQIIPHTPLSPIRTPTTARVLYNASSMHSPSDMSSSTEVSLPSPKERLFSNLETDLTTFHPLLAPSQTLSPLSCAVDTTSTSANKAESFSRSPPGPSNMAVAGVAPLLPVNVDSTMTPNHSITPLPPLLSHSSPPALMLSPPPSQLLSPISLHISPYQTPPHVHAIPSLSQSYPLDDLLDYEHGLELLSPPSPLSRTDSPFEFAELSLRPQVSLGSTLLLARSGDRRSSGGQLSTPPVDSITNSTSTAYLSFPSSPALSTSSVSVSSENGYENDSSRSEISSTFSSPIAASSRFGLGIELGAGRLPHEQAPVRHSMSPLSSRSSPSVDVDHPQHYPRQQQEGNFGLMSTRPSVPTYLTPTTSSQATTRRPTVALDEYDDDADTQTLSPRTRSPWMVMNRTPTESAATASISTDIQSVAQTSRAAMSGESDTDAGSELSDLDFLGMSAEEYEASDPTAATMNRGGGGSVGFRSRSGVYTGAGGVGSNVGRARRGDGNESDTSSWSLAGGSE